MYKETILSIEEFDDGGNAGYLIKTDCREIVCQISSDQQCCESWGYFSRPFGYEQSFVGAEISELHIVIPSGWQRIRVSVDAEPFKAAVAFLQFETSEGLLEFSVYNSHNGYYGHDIEIFSRNSVLNVFRFNLSL